MTREDAARIVELLKKTYPGFKSYTDPNAVAGWYVVLEHLTYDQVRAAVIDIIREGQSAPIPADVARRYPTTKKDEPARRKYEVTRDDFLRMLNYLWPDIPAEFSAYYDELLDYRRRCGYDA